MVDDTQNRSNSMVENIAEDIEAVARGDMYLYNGEYWTQQALEESHPEIEDE